MKSIFLGMTLLLAGNSVFANEACIDMANDKATMEITKRKLSNCQNEPGFPKDLSGRKPHEIHVSMTCDGGKSVRFTMDAHARGGQCEVDGKVGPGQNDD